MDKKNKESKEDQKKIVSRIDKSEILRRKLWYAVVMSRSKMSFYDMDCKFDLELSSRISDKSYEKRRRKLFEDLRDKNIMPFKGREFEFVNAVDSHKGFENTAIFYKSSFWKFIQKKPLTITEIRNLIVEILDQHDLLIDPEIFEFKNGLEPEARLKNVYQDSLSTNAQPWEYPLYRFQKILGNILSRIDFPLDKLTIVGALIREYILLGNLRFAAFLLNIYYEMVYTTSNNIDFIPEELRKSFSELCNERLISHYYQANRSAEPSYFSILETIERKEKVNEKSLAALLLFRLDQRW